MQILALTLSFVLQSLSLSTASFAVCFPRKKPKLDVAVTTKYHACFPVKIKLLKTPEDIAKQELNFSAKKIYRKASITGVLIYILYLSIFM